MKILLHAVLCAVLAFAWTLAFGQQPGPTITVDGVTYTDVHFGEKHGDTVDIFHSTGAANVSMEKLPPEIQKQLSYRPKKTAPQPAPAQKPAAQQTPAPKPPAPKPSEPKSAPPKPAAQKLPEQQAPERKTPEQKSNIEKLVLPTSEPEQTVTPKPVLKKAPALKPPVPEKPAPNPVEPAAVEKAVAPAEKPVTPKSAVEKPPIRKVSRQQAFARKPRTMEAPKEIEPAQWLRGNEKKVWEELWANYDAAAQEANTKYDAAAEPDRWREYQEELWSEHNAELRRSLGITPAMQKQLMEKGYREDWPVEKSPEDKVRIASDAGAKPVRDKADGSVAEVVSYLKEKLGDSNTVEYVRWYPPLLDETKDGYSWAVEVKYRSKNAEGSLVVETGTAYIRRNKVVDFKVRPGK